MRDKIACAQRAPINYVRIKKVWSLFRRAISAKLDGFAKCRDAHNLITIGNKRKREKSAKEFKIRTRRVLVNQLNSLFAFFIAAAFDAAAATATYFVNVDISRFPLFLFSILLGAAAATT